MPVDTKVLGAIIRQVDSHNKGVEVREMWKQWEKRREGRSEGSGTDSHGQSPQCPGKVADRRAKLREQLDKRRMAKRLLDRDRWGNEGFQSMYKATEGPTVAEPPDTTAEEKKKKKKKKEKDKDHKSKKKKKEKKSKKKRKKEKNAAKDTDSESDSGSEEDVDGTRDSVKRKGKEDEGKGATKRKKADRWSNSNGDE